MAQIVTNYFQCVVRVKLHPAFYYITSACVAEWVRPRASSCMYHELEGPGSTPGADTANQAVHPFEVGKLILTLLGR